MNTAAVARSRPTEPAADAQAVNFIVTRTQRVKCVCQCCGREGPPVKQDTDGGPSMWNLPRGWSTAPYPADYTHRDGSTGATYTCAACNVRLRKGETLLLRAYLATASHGAVRSVGAAS